MRKAYGLSFAVRPKGKVWLPAKTDANGVPLFGDLRLDAFETGLTIGLFQTLHVLGGMEIIYAEGSISRPDAICDMLAARGIDRRRLKATVTEGHTVAKVEGIRQDWVRYSPAEVAVVTNHYHLYRTAIDLIAAGMSDMPLLSAETLLRLHLGDEIAVAWMRSAFGDGDVVDEHLEEVAVGTDRLRRGEPLPTADTFPQPEEYIRLLEQSGEAALKKRLGNSPLALRMFMEVRGLLAKQQGKYRSRSQDK